MKLIRLFALAAVMVCSVSTSIAQTNLVGRVYENKNILADEMNKALKNADADIDKAKAEALERQKRKRAGN
jgi:peptidoglycan hydrolase CwlO-like protein